MKELAWRVARLVIATELGIVLGAEVMLAGPGALIHVGLLTLYLLLFLITDELRYKYTLSQRHIFVLGMILEIWFGALISQEVYQPGLPFPFGWGGLNLISLALVTTAWGMFLVTWMHSMAWLMPRPSQLRYLRLRHWLIVGLIAFLALYYLGNQWHPERFFEDASLVTLGTAGALAWRRWVRHAQQAQVAQTQVSEPQFSKGILGLAAVFVGISLLSVFLPLQMAFSVPLHILWSFLVWLPIFLIVVRRRPLRL